jgi:hypothetical protein
MLNVINRDSAYIDRLSGFLEREYSLSTLDIKPAKRGYYGETWKVDTTNGSYFIKLDYFIRHQSKFENSLPVVDYLCDRGIDFIGSIIKTVKGISAEAISWKSAWITRIRFREVLYGDQNKRN